MSLILDASAVAAWAFVDERSTSSLDVLRRVARDGAAAPAIWPFEVANLLLMGERRGRLGRGERDAFLKRLASMPIRIETAASDDPIRILPFADAHGLTAYDAAYLELASRMRFPLVTKDRLLITAAAKLGVELIQA